MISETTSVLRVLHVTNVWLRQTESWLYNQIKFLPNSIESGIICEKTLNLDQYSLPNIYTDDYNLLSYVVYRLTRKLNCKYFNHQILNVARKFNPRIIHGHYGYNGWHALEAARQSSARLIVTFYGYDIHQFPARYPVWNARYQEMFNSVDAILCEGEFMAESIRAKGVPHDLVRVHHLGVDLERVPFVPRTLSPGEPLAILIAGTFREKKGIPYALEAIGRISGRANLHVTVIGDACNPAEMLEKGKILDTVKRCHLESKVKFLGFQPYAILIREAYRHHIFMSPSVTASDGDCEGGAPVSIIEFAATGMPVLSTRHCDIPQIIRHGETGMLSPERDTDSLAENLERIIADRQLWDAVTRNARVHIESEYNARIQADKLEAIYRMV